MNLQKEIASFLLTNIIAKEIDLQPDLQLIDSGLIDSIRIVKLIVHLEKEYQIAFTTEDMLPQNFETLQAIVETVIRKKGEVVNENEN